MKIEYRITNEIEDYYNQNSILLKISGTKIYLGLIEIVELEQKVIEARKELMSILSQQNTQEDEILKESDKTIKEVLKQNEKNILIKEGSICLIPKDEVEALNNGEYAKVFVEGKEFYLEVIEQ